MTRVGRVGGSLKKFFHNNQLCTFQLHALQRRPLKDCPKKEITFHRGLGTSTKCRTFPILKTYLTKAKHTSFSFTILTNLIVAKEK